MPRVPTSLHKAAQIQQLEKAEHPKEPGHEIRRPFTPVSPRRLCVNEPRHADKKANDQKQRLVSHEESFGVARTGIRGRVGDECRQRRHHRVVARARQRTLHHLQRRIGMQATHTDCAGSSVTCTLSAKPESDLVMRETQPPQCMPSTVKILSMGDILCRKS